MRLLHVIAELWITRREHWTESEAAMLRCKARDDIRRAPGDLGLVAFLSAFAILALRLLS